jgi:mRNA-degrading endonuclease toxin of MazEF toxin-antitoxin module
MSLIIRMASWSALAVCLNGCATAPLTQTGQLSSYAELTPSDGLLTRTRQRIDKQGVLAARSIKIIPTRISAGARSSGLSDAQLQLVTNAIDRALCAKLATRFIVMPQDQPADLTVEAAVTHVGRTNVAAAGVSKAVNVAGTAAGAVSGVPIPVPRLPLGMGGLSVEAQAHSGRREVAAITWARGADMLTTRTRLSEEADAYSLATEFSSDFAKLLVSGSDPMKDRMPSLPTAQGVKEFFGGKPKHQACEQFGRQPGVAGSVGELIGLPPSWTDPGAR